MPVATRALREASLSMEIRAFGEEQLDAARVAEALRVRADVAARARACGEQLLQVGLPSRSCTNHRDSAD